MGSDETSTNESAMYHVTLSSPATCPRSAFQQKGATCRLPWIKIEPVILRATLRGSLELTFFSSPKRDTQH